jgi:hypothetical protein
MITMRHCACAPCGRRNAVWRTLRHDLAATIDIDQPIDGIVADIQAASALAPDRR